MLQYRILHYAEFAPAKLAQLNTAQASSSVVQYLSRQSDDGILKFGRAKLSTKALFIRLIIRLFRLIFFRRNNIFLSQQISQQCF
jgi:hypothetical protein